MCLKKKFVVHVDALGLEAPVEADTWVSTRARLGVSGVTAGQNALKVK